MIAFNLDDLNKHSLEKIREFFLTIPISEVEVEFAGRFHSKNRLESSPLLKAMPCLPRHIQSVVLRGKYIYQSDSHRERDALSPFPNASPGSRTVSYRLRSLGNLIVEYVSSLPHSVNQLSLIFSSDEAYEQGYSKTSSELQQLGAHLPNTVTDFRLNGMAARIHPSNFPEILKALSDSVTALYLENAAFNTCPSSKHNEIFLSLNANLIHLSLARCNLNTLTPNAFVFFFNGLSTSLLKSVNLGSNQLAKKPPKELALFFSRLPKQLEELLLADNLLSHLSSENLSKLLKYAPKTITHLDLSDNKLLFMPVKPLLFLLNSLSSRISSLRLCEQNTNSLPMHDLMARFTCCLPARINTLSFRQCNLLGRTMADFANLIHALPQTITRLDFSDNDLSKTSTQELICLFSNIPRHTQKLKLNRNGLGSMNRLSLEKVLSHLPPHVELDLGDNGFEVLPNSALNHLLDALPDGIMDFGNSRLRPKHTGSWVALPYKSTPFKQPIRLRHQKEFALLQLVLVQLIESSGIDFDMLQILLPFLFNTTTPDVQRMMKQMAKACTFIPAKNSPITPPLQNQSIKSLQFRLNTLHPKSSCADLSHCALYRLNREQLRVIFELPRTITQLKLKANGFLNNQWSKKNLFDTLKHLPTQIKYLDLSDNGFEKMHWEELKQLCIELPDTCLISLNHENPISPKEQIELRNIPASYQKLIQNATSPLQQARVLLDDYTKVDSSLVKRILSFDWFRKDSTEVRQLVASIDSGIITDIEDVLSELEHIDKNARGDLGKRWMHLFQNSRNKKPDARLLRMDTAESSKVESP